jgi:hypothetical protein
MWPCIVTNVFVRKPTRCTNFTIYFVMKLYMFRQVRLSIIRSLFAVHSEIVCHTGTVHTALEQDQDGTAVPSWSCSKAVYAPVWQIPLLSVQWINCWWWTDELSETCGVSWQNKFVKLVHLVGFITNKWHLCNIRHKNIDSSSKPPSPEGSQYLTQHTWLRIPQYVWAIGTKQNLSGVRIRYRIKWHSTWNRKKTTFTQFIIPVKAELRVCVCLVTSMLPNPITCSPKQWLFLLKQPVNIFNRQCAKSWQLMRVQHGDLKGLCTYILIRYKDANICGNVSTFLLKLKLCSSKPT